MQSVGPLAHEVPTVSVHSHQLPGHCVQHRRRGSHKTTAQTLSRQPKQSCAKRRNSCHRHRTCSHRLVQASAHNGASVTAITGTDLACLTRAAELADSSAGVSQPHPNSGCVLVSATGSVLAETYLAAQGTTSAEIQAVSKARQEYPTIQGCTAYLNLETGDCHGDNASLSALVQAEVSRVVIGMRHPLAHCRGAAIQELRQHGIRVDVLGEAPCLEAVGLEESALQKCFVANEALLHRAAKHQPLGIFKYAMTLDGKIATSMGHSAWVSSAISRQHVFENRARSDAVIVGGQTVRLDNPRLTTRRDSGHMPIRICMSRTLDLQEDANLWDVTVAPTVVMTQQGARTDFQRKLRARGVEVVEFDFLTPHAVAAYCYDRGFLQCLWECGGTLSAPAIAAGVIHKTLAFIAPKLIGGVRAPSPVGELGNVEMTQSLNIIEPRWQGSGPDMLLTGYLPASGGLEALDTALSGQPPLSSQTTAHHRNGTSPPGLPSDPPLSRVEARRRSTPDANKAVRFYKAWDAYGALSNFSCHAVTLPEGPLTDANAPQEAAGPLEHREWPSVEHYYQAQKFATTRGSSENAAIVELIAGASSPEEAARLGRRLQRLHPATVRPDWDQAKLQVMLAALRAKFTVHEGPRKLLLSTARQGSAPGKVLQESSPADFFWAKGIDGTGSNHLGRLLMQVRDELLLQTHSKAIPAPPSLQTTNGL
ncbi:hypothetical protein ABBQ32_006115 [Trebouxia sp. C0010 RCD-2024]